MSTLCLALLFLFQVVPVKRFYEFTWSKGVGLTFASMGMSSSCDGPADGTNLTAVGEIRLVPDLSTKKRLPWYRWLFKLLFFAVPFIFTIFMSPLNCIL